MEMETVIKSEEEPLSATDFLNSKVQQANKTSKITHRKSIKKAKKAKS